MTIQPITSHVFRDEDEDYEHVSELIGWEVRAKDGTVLGTGETQEEALENANRFILLPTRRV